MQRDCERVLLTEAQIQEGIKRLAERLRARFAGKNPLLVCLLKGSVIFFADLVRRLDFACEFDFMSVSSYGKSAKSAGTLRISKDLSTEIAGREVILVEDIIDTGNTLSRVKELLLTRKPASVTIVTLLNKPARRTVDLTPDDCCFEIEDEFVIGYGLDYAERYRNLPYIGVLKRGVYEN